MTILLLERVQSILVFFAEFGLAFAATDIKTVCVCDKELPHINAQFTSSPFLVQVADPVTDGLEA